MSRTIVFHEKVVTATSAASSRWRRSRLNSPKKREQPRSMALRRQRPRHPAERRKRRQGCQRHDRFVSAVGPTSPRPLSLMRHSPHGCSGERGTMAVRRSRRSAEAFSGVVKHPVPRYILRSPRLRGISTQRKLRQRVGNTRGTGTRQSFEWQTSVRHIACLGLW